MAFLENILVRDCKSLSAACVITITLGFSPSVCAEVVSEELTEEITVYGDQHRLPITTGDAAELLKKEGVRFYSAGGISQLPVLNGMNDDRIKLLIDGAETTSACANHMNPTLSYIDASRVKMTEVIAGITSVSVGGDSIAGTIVINSEQPIYSDSSGKLLTTGSFSGFYKSNARNHGQAVNAIVASDSVSFEYSGTNDRAESYYDGNGNKVLDTLYRAESHNFTLGVKAKDQQWVVKVNHQEVPYQGFPNQYMDMVGNVSNGINIHYVRGFSWGELDSRLTWQDVSHEMGFFTEEKTGTMPMFTEGTDLGYVIKASLPLSEKHTVSAGNEFHRFQLDDWWPAVEGSMMMGPNEFVNLYNSEKSRLAFWVESEYQFNSRWMTVLGIRYEHVETDTGDVQPYNTMPVMMMPNLDASAATAFNNRSRKQLDDNIDLTLLAKYEPSEQVGFEFGYARKTRSPNLYERYSWGQNTMAMTMIGWFGDMNGYVGRIDLNPEVAHTVSASLKLRGAQDNNWELSVKPYYSYVDDYIDVNPIGSFHPRMVMSENRAKLQFTNADADFYGIEAQGRKSIWADQDWGKGTLSVSAGYTRAKRHYTEDDLYHIMPLNVRASIEQTVSRWVNLIEVEWVNEKDRVDALRLENTTDSYTLVNASTQVLWKHVSLSLGARNLLGEAYDLPLGGVSYAQWRAAGMGQGIKSIPGQGRSVDFGFKYQF